MIVGLHDSGGIGWMMRNGKTGVALDHVVVGSQPVALDYRKAKDAGITVIVRLNYSYADGGGTLPPPTALPAFEKAVAKTMRDAVGVAYFQYGNEINNKSEWPNGFSVTPEYYIQSYNRVWFSVPTRVLVGPSPIDPYFGPNSNNREWWTMILRDIAGTDVLFLHPKTQSNDPNEIWSDAMFGNEPLTWQYLHFKTVETSLEVVPKRFRSKPVFIAEANPQRIDARRLGWKPDNTAWIANCKEYVQSWNDDARHQPINGIVFYRYEADDWALSRKPRLLAEIFR